jgi:bifunctional DNase/RNase
MGDEQIVPIAVNFDGLSFDQPNQFSLVFSIDGTEMRRLPIRVRLIEALAIQSVA